MGFVSEMPFLSNEASKINLKEQDPKKLAQYAYNLRSNSKENEDGYSRGHGGIGVQGAPANGGNISLKQGVFGKDDPPSLERILPINQRRLYENVNF